MAVVYTNDFSVASDQNLETAFSEWAKFFGGAGENLQILAAEDYVTPTVLDTEIYYRLVSGAGAITGDQDITADARVDTAADSASLCARCNATSGGNGYVVFFRSIGPPDLWRLHNGSFTQISTGWTGNTLTTTVASTVRLRATGAGATVSIEVQVDAGSPLTYNDTDTNRKTSGTPGIGAYAHTNLNNGRIDNISIDDLGGGSLTLTPSGSEVTGQSGTPTVLTVFNAWTGLRLKWA
jgi:hypothetical protein